MINNLFKSTEIVSYFLWEYTKHKNALDLWYCGEELALFFEGLGMLNFEDVLIMKNLDRQSDKYIEFVRNIAYRVHLFTKNDDADANWFASEKLIQNGEWCMGILGMANIYKDIRDGKINDIAGIRTDSIRRSFK